MGLHASILIALATRPDDTADEGPGLDSSPFSHRLIQALETRPMDPMNVVFDDLTNSVAVAAAVWDTLGVNGAADRDDIAEVTRRFQGVQAAAGPRAIWLAQAKTALGM